MLYPVILQVLPLMPFVNPVPQPEPIKTPIDVGNVDPFVFRWMKWHQSGENLCNEVWVNPKITHRDEIDVRPNLFMYQLQNFIGGNPRPEQ